MLRLEHTSDNSETNNPATKFPAQTGKIDSLNFKPKNTAIAVPVHTPVIGKGIATKINTAKIFKELSLVPSLLLFILSSKALFAFSEKKSSNLIANLEKGFHFFKRFINHRGK